MSTWKWGADDPLIYRTLSDRTLAGDLANPLVLIDPTHSNESVLCWRVSYFFRARSIIDFLYTIFLSNRSEGVSLIQVNLSPHINHRPIVVPEMERCRKQLQVVNLRLFDDCGSSRILPVAFHPLGPR